MNTLVSFITVKHHSFVIMSKFAISWYILISNVLLTIDRESWAEMDPAIQEVIYIQGGCCIQCHAVYTTCYKPLVFVFPSICHLIHHTVCVCACSGLRVCLLIHQSVSILFICPSAVLCRYTFPYISARLSLCLPWLCREESRSTGQTDAFWHFGFTFSSITMSLEPQ